ncbi:MAG: hypothetical protein ACRC8K_02925 [Waterburya sp.]
MSILPWILSHVFQISNVSNRLRKILLTVEVSFYIGGVLFLGTVLWTIVTTSEYPPQNLTKFRQQQASLAFLIPATDINDLTKESKNLETQGGILLTATVTNPVSEQKTP